MHTRLDRQTGSGLGLASVGRVLSQHDNRRPCAALPMNHELELLVSPKRNTGNRKHLPSSLANTLRNACPDLCDVIRAAVGAAAA